MLLDLGYELLWGGVSLVSVKLQRNNEEKLCKTFNESTFDEI